MGLASLEPVSPVEPAQPSPTVVEARPRPPRSRGRILPVALRLVSLAGLATSAVGGWMLVRPPAQAAPDPLAAGATVVADPGATPEPVEPASASCENAVLGYSVTYPAGWFTAARPEEEACRYFDTTSVEPSSGDGLPATAVRIYLDERTYRHYDRRFDPEAEPDVLDRLNLTVGGHPAFRVELATYNEEAGSSTLYAYVVDMGGAVLVLDAYAPYSDDDRGARDALDSIASSLDFTSGDAG